MTLFGKQHSVNLNIGKYWCTNCQCMLALRTLWCIGSYMFGRDSSGLLESPDIFIAQYTPSCAYYLPNVFTGANITNYFVANDRDALCNKTCKYNSILHCSVWLLISYRIHVVLVNQTKYLLYELCHNTCNVKTNLWHFKEKLQQCRIVLQS